MLEKQKDYQAPVWCPTGHLQTIFAALYATNPTVTYDREIVTLLDGDIVAWDWVRGDRTGHRTPIVILFHGLEGSSQSHYALRLMATVAQKGWIGLVPHFRGCGGVANRLPRAYYAGDHWYVKRVVDKIRLSYPHNPLYAVGVSLGGNMLSFALGYYGKDLSIAKASVVCSPFDLQATSMYIHQWKSRIFRRHLLRSLNHKMRRKHRYYPEVFQGVSETPARSFYEFDSRYTAPLHGYRDARDYWQKCSSKALLSRVQTPLLVINTRNDPFIPRESLPVISEVSSDVHLELFSQGGHVGFVSDRFPGKNYFLSRHIIRFFVSGG